MPGGAVKGEGIPHPKRAAASSAQCLIGFWVADEVRFREVWKNDAKDPADHSLVFAIVLGDMVLVSMRPHLFFNIDNRISTRLTHMRIKNL